MAMFNNLKTKISHFLSPNYFLIGILTGFILCIIAGHIISHKARFHHFNRFFLPIQPQMQYYPTTHELLQTVRHYVDHEKTLVLIGGNSIFRGTGQNINELWTNELQKLLGDEYRVVNFAIDQASAPSFAGVIFKILSNEYPKIIYATTCTPQGEGLIEGIDVYSYLFWDAYYKKLYSPNDQNELEKIQQLRNEQLKTPQGLEKHILTFLDSYFYFRNLWNWIGYRFFFTVWSDKPTKSIFLPLNSMQDIKVNYKALIEKGAGEEAIIKTWKKNMSDYISGFIDISKSTLQINEATQTAVRKNYEDIFASHYRSKILCVIPYTNPKIISQLPKESQKAFSIILNQTRLMIEKLGYHAIVAGDDFLSDDFMDQGHFNPSGGKKVAIKVASKIKEINMK